MRNSSKRGSASEPAGKARKPPRARLDERLADAKKFLLPTYKREPVVMTHGQGAYVFDSTGKKYLDFLGGIAVNALGHAHSRIVKVIRREAARAIHLSNLYHHAFQGPLEKDWRDESRARFISPIFITTRFRARWRASSPNGPVWIACSFRIAARKRSTVR